MTNKILALKYRPQQFEDLIGQEVISQTIVNGIKLKKTPNAYLLTGIRGVGKTTTARLIAKALNCEKINEPKVNCSSEKFCNTCQEIINSNHIDIIEMDAASKTGIDDIRQLIENSKYSPISANFKIFIIDEAHMLSKQAFNGLLKTLEEPPAKLKFILATTEVRKIPVTILSRCQRLDLKRVSMAMLSNNLKKIAKNEKGKITDGAINIISKASEGSVRDSISLLDRALISQSTSDSKPVEENDVREMLGLADRSKLIHMLREVLTGNEKGALELLKELINDGLDAKNFLNDMLELLYLFSRRISLGPIDHDTSVSEEETKLIDVYSENLNIIDVGLFWQLTIKTLDDLKIVGDENLALEMYIIQLIHLKNINQKRFEDGNFISNDKNKDDIESFGKKIETLNEKSLGDKVKSQLKSIDQVKTKPLNQKNDQFRDSKIQITSFQDLIEKTNLEKEIELKYDLERNVKLVSFNKGKIDISFNEKLNKNFIKNLTEKLLKWTGDRWIISLSKNTIAKSIHEKNLEDKVDQITKFNKSKLANEIKITFPDAELIEINRREKND